MWKRKLTTWHIIILPGGILINLGCMALLSVLWFADSDSSALWQRIVLNGWATRWVVIISMVIRTVVGFHGVICVSMLCALVLEKFETPLPKVAAASIMRFQNGGVFDLAFFAFLVRGAPTAQKALLAIPGGLLFVVLVGLQFTSTALLSDFGPRLMVLQQPETPYAYAFLNSTEDEVRVRVIDRLTIAMETSYSCGLNNSPLFPAFLEYAEPPKGLPDGAFDTGALVRGFLPFNQESQRTELVRYSGMATLYDNRVVCVRPTANLTSIQLRILEDEKLRSNVTSTHPVIYAELSGYVGSDLVVPRFNRSSSPVWLNCSGSGASPQSFMFPNIEDWPLVICNVDAGGGPLPSMGDPVSHTYLDLADFLYAPETDSFLVLNTSYTGPTGHQTLLKPGPTKINSTSVRYMGEWLQIEFPHNFSASLSLCYTSDEVRIKEVDVFRPPSGWEARKGRAAPWPPVVLGLSRILFGNNHDGNNSSSICYGCMINSAISPTMHFAHASVFNQIIRETLSPGLALQALLTSLHAAEYYSVSYLFSETANATAWIRTTGSAPVRSLFFGLVLATIAFEIVLTVGITLAFLWGTRYTSLGNAWQSVSQVTGNHVDKWRADSTLTDGEIKLEMECEGSAENLEKLRDATS
ncbi:hypothetical protein B0T22DRAFT_443478 [Podospora appendiculata]|uniref:Uncharacterized protein n=1 Tax=Podospora appendiculata TaxID=314037 RepID=A0AAE0X2A8_9PEZI|nr:hypothetical protein B0T22DRAFT_443478 [Podospora appendiculata]